MPRFRARRRRHTEPRVFRYLSSPKTWRIDGSRSLSIEASGEHRGIRSTGRIAIPQGRRVPRETEHHTARATVEAWAPTANSSFELTFERGKSKG